MYFSNPLHVKLDEESNGANFKTIHLVCSEQLSKNAKHVFGEKVYKHYKKMI